MIQKMNMSRRPVWMILLSGWVAKISLPRLADRWNNTAIRILRPLFKYSQLESNTNTIMLNTKLAVYSAPSATTWLW